jgi:signal transduction histidine kinase
VDDRNFARLGAVTGLAATLTVGVSLLFATLAGTRGPTVGPVVLWWISYLLFVTAFSADILLPEPRPRWLTDRWMLPVQVGAAAATYLLDARFGWTAVLLVVTAASGAHRFSLRGSMTLVAVQSALIGAGQLAAGIPPDDALLAVLIYGSFQAFAVVMVNSERREAAARAELATAHAELRASSALLAESSRTAERLRIARELHDLVGHQLTALSLELEVASHHTDGVARDHVVRARNSAKGLLSDVRAAVGELRVTTASIEAPLRALVDGLSRPAVSLRVVEEVAVDEDRALAVVRCVQEIVTNTLRHADAEHLWITVRATREGVHVEARDDGRGVAVLRPGNGLTGMRERLAALGGEMRLDTAEGQGFRVAARVPAT